MLPPSIDNGGPLRAGLACSAFWLYGDSESETIAASMLSRVLRVRSSTSADVRLLVDIGGRTGYPASVPSRRGRTDISCL